MDLDPNYRFGDGGWLARVGSAIVLYYGVRVHSTMDHGPWSTQNRRQYFTVYSYAAPRGRITPHTNKAKAAGFFIEGQAHMFLSAVPSLICDAVSFHYARAPSETPGGTCLSKDAISRPAMEARSIGMYARPAWM